MKFEFTKPQSFNGVQLVKELKENGIEILGFPEIDANGVFWLDIDEKKKSQVATIVAAHNGVDTTPTLTDKLASVGLSIEDLKAALQS